MTKPLSACICCGSTSVRADGMAVWARCGNCGCEWMPDRVKRVTEAEAREAFREHATKQGYYLGDWGNYVQVWLAAYRNAGLLIEE